MSAMALGQAVAGMSLLSSGGGSSKQAGLLDAASGLRRCKADCVRLAAFTVPQLQSQRLKLEVRAGTGNTYGTVFRVTTFGESHGGGVGCVIDGCPPRLPLSEADMQVELDRRRPGQSRITTPRSETDTCKIISGVGDGLTLGTPIAVTVPNTDQRGKDYTEISVAYCPSHAANLLTIGSRGRSATQVCEGAPGDRVRAWREAVGMNGAVVVWRGSENRRRVLGLRVEAGGGGDTMWVTATAAVALVLSLAAFAAIGGFLLSKGMDNQIREEEEEMEELKAKGLYSEPKVTQYEEQGVGTSKRNRRVSEE